MKSLLYLPFACTLLFLASCAPKENNNDQTSIHARADSAVGVRMQEINQEAMESLEKRIAVEVRAKADSIIAVRTGTAPKLQPVTDAAPPVVRKNMLPAPTGNLRTNDSTKR